MSLPAFRCEVDVHLCPHTNGIVPHSAGTVGPSGSRTVLICGSPAATMGDVIHEVGMPNVVIAGSNNVFIDGRAAARVGDYTAHGTCLGPGPGAVTVLIG